MTPSDFEVGLVLGLVIFNYPDNNRITAQVSPGVRVCLVCQAVLHCAGGLRGLVQLPLGDRPQLRAQRHRGGHPQGPEVTSSSKGCCFMERIEDTFRLNLEMTF